MAPGSPWLQGLRPSLDVRGSFRAVCLISAPCRSPLRVDLTRSPRVGERPVFAQSGRSLSANKKTGILPCISVGGNCEAATRSSSGRASHGHLVTWRTPNQAYWPARWRVGDRGHLGRPSPWRSLDPDPLFHRTRTVAWAARRARLCKDGRGWARLL